MYTLARIIKDLYMILFYFICNCFAHTAQGGVVENKYLGTYTHQLSAAGVPAGQQRRNSCLHIYTLAYVAKHLHTILFYFIVNCFVPTRRDGTFLQ